METTLVKEEASSSIDDPRVLFVDDSPDERELFPLRFSGRFSRSVVVGSVAEALDVLKDGETELVLTDIALPDASGLDLVRRMREMAPEVGGIVPAIAVTGLCAAEDFERADAAGFSGYVLKPYENAELLSVVDRVAPSVVSLRRVRERLREGIAKQHDVRERLFAQRKILLEQRERYVIKYGRQDDVRLHGVFSAARSFAEAHFERAVDDLEISAARLLPDGSSSWVVIAVCDRELLFVEVVDVPVSDFVARRFDT